MFWVSLQLTRVRLVKTFGRHKAPSDEGNGIDSSNTAQWSGFVLAKLGVHGTDVCIM